MHGTFNQVEARMASVLVTGPTVMQNSPIFP